LHDLRNLTSITDEAMSVRAYDLHYSKNVGRTAPDIYGMADEFEHGL
jgi:hypothetical protein